MKLTRFCQSRRRDSNIRQLAALIRSKTLAHLGPLARFRLVLDGSKVNNFQHTSVYIECVPLLPAARLGPRAARQERRASAVLVYHYRTARRRAAAYRTTWKGHAS